MKNSISDKPPLNWTYIRKGTVSQYIQVNRCIVKTLRTYAYTQPSLILMFPAFYIVTKALLFGEKGLTFSYDAQCRKYEQYIINYIQHIYNPSLILMFPAFYIVTNALLFGEKGLTFSYDAQCRKYEQYIINYIQHIYKCELNG